MRRLLSLLLLCLFGATPALAEVSVVATLPDLGALARAVGGDRVQVTVLASPAEDPHYVDPRPSFILALNKADLLLLNGMQLEAGWLAPLLVQARNGRIQAGAPGYLDASTVVQPIEVPATVDRAQGDIHPGGNPHFLFDPRAAQPIARLIGQRLAAVDPPNAALYQARAEAVATELKGLAEAQRARFAALPVEKRRVVAYHRSLGYLVQWLGLTQVQTVEPKPGIPPNPAHTAQVLQTMKATGARVILQESYYPARVSKTLARLVKGEVLQLAGGTPKGGRYVDRIKALTDAIHAALQ